MPRRLPLLLLLCLQLHPGAHQALQGYPQQEDFDLQGSIIVNQLAISQLMAEKGSCEEGIAGLQTKLENLTESLSSHLTDREKRYQDALERDNVTRRVLERLDHLEIKNLTCDDELMGTSETQKLRQEKTQLQEDSLRVKEEIRKVEEENRKLRDDLRLIEEENRERKEEVRQLEEDVRLLQERNRVLEETNGLNDTLRMIAELERKNEQQEKLNTYIEEEKNLLQEKVADIEEQNRELQERNKILAEESSQREQENSRLEAEKSDIEEKNRIMEEEHTRCERNVTELSTRKVLARDCAELYCTGERRDGVYTISPGSGSRLVTVWCDMSTERGGWTVFLLRQQQIPEENFSRDWEEYKQGFGNTWAEHWIGTEALHQLTIRTPHVLRMEATNLDNELRWAQWSTFSVGSEDTSYQLEIGEYDEDSCLGDSMVSNHNLNHTKFSTKDRDNDGAPLRDCVQSFSVGGGWWYNNCAYITPTGLHRGSGKHMLAFWTPGDKRWISLNRLQMKVRPQGFSACLDTDEDVHP